MSSGSGNGGFGRRVRAEWWLRSSRRARVPSGHCCARTSQRRLIRAPSTSSDRTEHVNGREPFVGEGREGVGEPAVLAPERRRWRPWCRTKRVALQRNGQRHIEHDRHRGSSVTPRETEQLAPHPLLDVRGVHHGQPAAPEAHLHEPMQKVEGVIGCALRRRVVGDQGAKRVGGEDFGRREVARSERRLPAGGDADQHDQGIGREVDRRENRPTAVRVGGRWSCHRGRSALGVAVRAHLRLGNRRLRLSDRARQSASADRGAGLTDEVDLAEVAIRQAPRHITALTSRGRGHRAGTPVRVPILPDFALFHKPVLDLAAWPNTR